MINHKERLSNVKHVVVNYYHFYRWPAAYYI